MCVNFLGWREGIRKVALDLLLNQEAGIPLSEARANVDRLISGQSFCITLPVSADAEEFAEQANHLGAICELQTEVALASV